MKKLVAILLVMIMALSLFAGCGGNSFSNSASSNDSNLPGNSDSSSAEEEEKRTDVVIGMDADPGTFNPYASAATAYKQVKLLVYQTLMYLDENKELVNILAESWEKLDDLTYTVKMKENIYDTNGNHITAEDFVFSAEQHINGNGYATWKYSDKEKPVEAIGEYEIQLNFAQKTCIAFEQICSMVVVIDKESYEASTDQFVNKPVGTGPYKLDNWVVGSELTFVKNEKYWDDNPYKLFVQNMDKITFKIIPEAAQRAIELETGEVDFIYDLQTEDVDHLKNNDEIVPVEFLGSKVLSIHFGCFEESPCKDVRLRKAVAYATNTAVLAASENLGVPAASYVHPIQRDWMPDYENRILYGIDMYKAKSLVKELKEEGAKLSFEIKVENRNRRLEAAKFIQGACKEIGITVEIEKVPTDSFGSPYTFADAYIGVYTYELYAACWMKRQIDRTGYPMPSELRDTVNMAFEEFTEETSREAVAKWEEEIPVLPLVYCKEAVAYNKELKNVDIDAFGFVYPGSFEW